MTTNVTTQREIVPEEDGVAQESDSPAVSTRARARIPVTGRKGSTKTPRVSPLVAVRAWAASWWVWIDRPPSLRRVWQMSKVDPRRIPNGAPIFQIIWAISNWTDRLIMFALVPITPVALAGPVRWLTIRPFRRYGLYLTLAALTAAHLLGRS